MPHDEPDETDPMMLVGVELPADEAALLESARVFAEEFAGMGFDESQVLEIFRSPFYGAPHRALLVLGDEKVGAIVRDACAPWAAIRFRVRDTEPGCSLRLLPVLDGTASPPGRDHHV